MKQTRDIAEVMTTPVVSVGSVTRVFDALQVARDHGIHHLAVVDNSALKGVVCTCDLREAALAVSVASVMQPVVAKVTSDANVREAAELMLSRGVGSVLVMAGEKPLGIVTRRDLHEQGEAIADLMSSCKCVVCGSIQHLRIGRDGEYLCMSCRERAEPGGWFDLGDGD